MRVINVTRQARGQRPDQYKHLQNKSVDNSFHCGQPVAQQGPFGSEGVALNWTGIMLEFDTVFIHWASVEETCSLLASEGCVRQLASKFISATIK